MSVLDAKDVHSLTLKVMRLSKPGFQIVPPLLCEKDDLPGDILIESNRENGRHILEGFGLTDFLQLPTSFGIIYLGETFRIYISLNNPTQVDVHGTVLKVELQTTTQLVPLFANTTSVIEKFAPGVSHDYVVAHEVREAGVNILACTVNYIRYDGEKKFFRKFFKFQVMNPLAITPRVHTMKNSIMVEANIENSTQAPLYIERVSLIPVDESLAVTDMNLLEPNPTNPLAYSAAVVYMKPATARQYLFMLTPRADYKTGNSTVIGQLDITWRSTLGELGRIKSLPLQKKISTDDVELTLTSVPQRIVLEQPFVVTLQITNRGPKFIQPQLVVLKNIMDGLLVNGHLEQDMGDLSPNMSNTLLLHMFPVKPGMQKITGLSVRVPDSNGIVKAYDFNNLADVFVDHA